MQVTDTSGVRHIVGNISANFASIPCQYTVFMTYTLLVISCLPLLLATANSCAWLSDALKRLTSV